MSTCMRGVGCYKKDLFNALVETYHWNHFTYKDAKQLPGFEHRAFMALYHDGMLHFIKKGSERFWRVSIRNTVVVR